MSNCRNKRFHITIFDIIIICFFLALTLIASYFVSVRNETVGIFNIEKTNVDYIITAPSKEQVAEIQSLDSVDIITPYLYRTIEFKGEQKTIKSNLFIIEDVADVEYTVFSDDLIIDRSLTQYDNPLFISVELANNAGLSIDSDVTLTLHEEKIRFNIQGIYKSDYRHIGGTAIAILVNNVATTIGDNYRYNGAYICSNDISATNDYLKSYIPLGDLRGRDDFDTVEQYQIYLEDRENTDHTQKTFYREAFLSELHNRNDAKLARELMLVITIFAGAVFMVVIWLMCKTLIDIKNNTAKDIYNSFSVKQEKQMYNRYFAFSMIIYIAVFCLSVVIALFVFGNSLLTAYNIVGLIATFIAVLIVWLIATTKLNNDFLMKTGEDSEQ